LLPPDVHTLSMSRARFHASGCPDQGLELLGREVRQRPGDLVDPRQQPTLRVARVHQTVGRADAPAVRPRRLQQSGEVAHRPGEPGRVLGLQHTGTALVDGPQRTKHLRSLPDRRADSLFPGGVGNTQKDEQRFASLIDDVERKLFALPDSTWFYPGHGSDSTLAAERPNLPEWRARGW
jgi:hypothetical protein